MAVQHRGSNWTPDEDRRLLDLVKDRKSWVFISANLKRTAKTAKHRFAYLRREVENEVENHDGEIMPSRPSHLPHNLERTALQKMSAEKGLPSSKLHPAGKSTIAGMLAKGWIVKQTGAGDGVKYLITPAGEAALKAKIPLSKH
jgi:hypothetical protein